MLYWFPLISIIISLRLISITEASVGNGSATGLPSRIGNSGCQFYGYVEKNINVWNIYTIQLAGWGNDGTRGGCALGLLAHVRSQCRAEVLDWACDEVQENMHDTEVSFRIAKGIVEQPDCATEAIRLASEAEHKSEIIDCICLADCWPSELRSSRGPGG